jgi:hypothetical protein
MGSAWDPRITAVVRTLGVRELVDPAPGSDPPVGQLEVTALGTRRLFPVGAQALAEGILLGRYDRCQGWDVLADTEVSRVHALIVQLRHRLVAVDTASTNGTFLGTHRVRVAELWDGMPLGLGCRGESGFGGAAGDPYGVRFRRRFGRRATGEGRPVAHHLSPRDVIAHVAAAPAWENFGTVADSEAQCFLVSDAT